MLQLLYSDENPSKPIALIGWMEGMTLEDKTAICEELYLKIRSQWTLEAIKKIIQNYDQEVVVDMINSYINDKMIQTHLCHILPQTTGPIILHMVKYKVPVEIIESVVDRININYVGSDTNTCLWEATRNGDYLFKLLSSKKLNFDINHLNECNHTFFTNNFNGHRKTDFTHSQNALLIKIIKILQEKKYNFNTITNNSESLLDMIFACQKTADMQIVVDIVSMEEYNPLSTTHWLHILIKSYSMGYIKIIVNCIIMRTNYGSSLNKIMCEYAGSYATSDVDMLSIIKLMQLFDNEKLTEMIIYANDMGDTVAHIASKYHLDRTLRFIMTDTVHLFGKNLLGYTPFDLYEEYSMNNILWKKINKEII